MITLYQEQTPFSNKRLDKQISKDALYTNPVIMPYAFNSTSEYNSLETVIYIRNNDPSKYYTNIVVALMTEETTDSISNSTGAIYSSPASGIYLSLPSTSIPLVLDTVYESYVFTDDIRMTNKYKSNYVPVISNELIEIKFSYGYDELSNHEWSKKKSGLLIPYIGNSSLYDMSYIPIRMRVNFLSEPAIYTIRDYFIDISYEEELDVTG